MRRKMSSGEGGSDHSGHPGIMGCQGGTHVLAWLCATCVALVLMLAAWATPAQAACGHPYVPTQFDYRVFGAGNEGDVDTWAYCDVCGSWYLYCSAADHAWQQVDAAYPTCTSEGYYVIECALCGATWRTVTSPPTGHHWGEWDIASWPSCEANGFERRACYECGEIETRQIPATGHSWGAWQRIQEPFCLTSGYEARYCATCGAEEKHEITPLGHAWGEWQTTLAPTCTAGGTEWHACTRCGETESREVAPLGHAWGEWTTLQPAAFDRVGVEQRACSVCGETEKRTVMPNAADAIAQKGSSGLLVFVLQQLLTEEGYDLGGIDGSFGNMTEAALNAFQANNGLVQTDLVFEGTIQFLLGRFCDRHLPGDLGDASDGHVTSYDSGLVVDAVLSDAYAGHGDGTHRVTTYVRALAFSRAGETLTLDMTSPSNPNGLEIAASDEPCNLGNETHTCDLCGYHDGLLVDLAYVTLVGFDSWVLFDDPPELSSWPSISNLEYEPWAHYLTWDAHPGADNYLVEISEYDASTNSEHLITSRTVSEANLDLRSCLDSVERVLKVSVTARKGQDAVSAPTSIGFTYLVQMPAVSDLVLKNGLVTWSLPDAFAGHTEVRVRMIDGGVTDRTIAETWVTDASCCDLTELVSDADMKGYKSYYVELFVIGHGLYDIPGSEKVTSATARWKSPTYVMTTSAVTLRADARQDAARLGGISAEQILRVTDEKDGYYQVTYGGHVGWILASACVDAKAEYHTITLDPGKGEGKPVTVNTKFNGRIDLPDLSGWSCAGCASYTFSTNREGTDVVDIAGVFTDDMTLYAVWQRDINLVLVRYAGIYGDTMLETYVKRGGRVSEYPGKGEAAQANRTLHWYTQPDGKGERVDPSQYVIAADAPETIVLYAFPSDQTELYIDSPTILFSEPDRDSDVIRKLRDETVTVLDVAEGDAFYHVRTSLGETGYIRVKSTGFRSFYIHFDANGGWCETKMLYATSDGTFEARFPTPVRDGYVFGGWADEGGHIYSTDLITEEPPVTNLFLKAVWHQLDGIVTQAILVGKANGRVNLYREPNPDAGYIADDIEPATFVTALSTAKNGMVEVVTYKGTFWVNQGDIAFGYATYSISSRQVPAISVPVYGAPSSKAAVYCVKLYVPTVFYVVGEQGDYYQVAMNLEGTNLEQAWVRKSWFDSTSRYATCASKNTVTFNCNGGSAGGMRSITRELDGDGTLPSAIPIPQRAGYTFTGWFTEPIGGTQATVETVFSSNVTLYAHYKGGSQSVCAVTSGNGTRCYYDAACTKRAEVIDNGTMFYAEEVSPGLFKINWNGLVRYIPDPKRTKVAHGEGVIAYYNPRASNVVRSYADDDAKKLGEVEYGSSYVAFGTENGYYRIAFDTGGEYENGFAYSPMGTFYKE